MALKFGSSYKAIQVGLFDGSNLARSINKNSKAVGLLDNLLQMFNIVERDYFGLYFMSDGQRKWLELDKNIWRQIQHLDPPYQLHFGMQFYPRDPILLQEEITTYFLYLQLRKDVIENRIVANEKDRAEMCAYILQGEGTSSSSDSYIKKHRHFFVHLDNSSAQLESRILQNLDKLSGMNGVVAEAKLIEKALPAVLYGMEPFHVRSEAHPSLTNLTLTVCPIGIMVYKDYVRMEIFSWTELWNAGYGNKTFWFRIFRDGENSKHNFVLVNKKYCKFVWMLFKHYFKFYVKDHSIPPKVAWGRVAPTVERTNMLQGASIADNIGADILNPLALSTSMNRQFPVPTTQL